MVVLVALNSPPLSAYKLLVCLLFHASTWYSYIPGSTYQVYTRYLYPVSGTCGIKVAYMLMHC